MVILRTVLETESLRADGAHCRSFENGLIDDVRQRPCRRNRAVATVPSDSESPTNRTADFFCHGFHVSRLSNFTTFKCHLSTNCTRLLDAATSLGTPSSPHIRLRRTPHGQSPLPSRYLMCPYSAPQLLLWASPVHGHPSMVLEMLHACTVGESITMFLEFDASCLQPIHCSGLRRLRNGLTQGVCYLSMLSFAHTDTKTKLVTPTAVE